MAAEKSISWQMRLGEAEIQHMLKTCLGKVLFALLFVKLRL